MSRRCLVSELQRFPVLRKRMDEVISNFLREGLHPAEAMIGHIIEMEMDYINASHPNFIGGAKAVGVAANHIKSSRAHASLAKLKDAGGSEKRTVLARPANGVIAQQSSWPAGDVGKAAPAGGTTNSRWRIPAIFSGSDNSHTSSKESSTNKSLTDTVHNTLDHAFSSTIRDESFFASCWLF